MSAKGLWVFICVECQGIVFECTFVECQSVLWVYTSA